MKVTNILVVTCSPTPDSKSNYVANVLLNKLRERKSTEVKVLDLSSVDIPFLNWDLIQSFYSSDYQGVKSKELELSDKLCDDFIWADEIIFAMPMWNYGAPSVVKAYIDLISRPGKLFNFTKEGLVSYISNKKIYLVVSSGSVFSEGKWAKYDQLVPYFKSYFELGGINDLHVIRVEGLDESQFKHKSIELALTQIEQIFR